MPCFEFKVLLLGDPSTGREEFVNRYTSRLFREDYKLAIGVDFCSKNQEFRGKKVRLQIWNFGGSEQSRFLLPRAYKNAGGAIIMYDITNRLSLKQLPDWTQIIREQSGDIPILLVGNNLDLEKSREVPKEEGILTAKEYNLSMCVELSTKTGQNVEKTLAILTKILMDYIKPF